jgi:hypothetical protein
MAYYQSIDIDYYDIRIDSVFYYVKTKIQKVSPESFKMCHFFNYLFCYDYDTGKLYWKNNPTFVARGREAGYTGRRSIQQQKQKSKYEWLKINIGNSFKDLKLHRVIYTMVYGRISDEKVIDHIDRNPMNNRIDNLREVDMLVNSRNAKKPNNNTSGVAGISLCKKTKRWRSFISLGKKQIHLGNYKDKIEAVYARLFGEICLGWDISTSNTMKFIDDNS